MSIFQTLQSAVRGAGGNLCRELWARTSFVRSVLTNALGLDELTREQSGRRQW